MNRPYRFQTLLGSLILATLALGPAPPAQAQSTAQEELQPVGDCVRVNRRVAVVFMVDESGSLGGPRGTDPAGDRVTGLQAALAGLSELTAGESGVEVQLSMWGFSVGATVRQDWVQLGADNVEELKTDAESFRGRDRGFDTDYIVALEASKDALAQQVAGMDPNGDQPVCKLLLWFTDGKFDIDDRRSASTQSSHGTTKHWAPDIDLTQTGSGDQAAQRGRQLMCQPNGVVQQLRNDSVFNAVVALETVIEPSDVTFLTTVADGQVQGAVPCGVPGPDAERAGAYLPARNVEDLIFSLFEATGPPVVPPGTESRNVCPNSEPCPGGTKEFSLDASLSRFNVLAVSRIPEIAIILRGPNGDEVDLGRRGRGSANLSGADVSWSWLSPAAVLVSGVLPTDPHTWVGTWQMTFVDTSGTNADVENRVAVYVFGELEARVVPGTRLRKGEPGELTIHLVNSGGQPQTDATLVESTRVTASLTVPGDTPQILDLEPGPNATFIGRYTPPEDLESVVLNLRTEVTIQTSAGVSLPTVGVDQAVPVDPPVGFPSIRLDGRGDALLLSAVEEADGSAIGTFQLEGLPNSGACVWLMRGETNSGPEEVSEVGYSMSPGSSEAECVQVGEADVGIQVEGQVAGTGHGRVNGELVLSMRSDATGEVREEHIPIQFEMAIPFETDKGLALLLLVLGIGAPLLVLYLLSWRGARFSEIHAIQFVNARGLFGVGGVRRDDGKRLFDGVQMLTPESRRDFTVGSFRLRSRMPISPLGAAEGRATHAEGWPIVGSRGMQRDGAYTNVPLGLGRLWVVAAEPNSLLSRFGNGEGLSSEVSIDVLAVFGSDESFDAQLKRVEEEVDERLTDLLTTLAQHIQGAHVDERGGGGDSTHPPGEPDDPRGNGPTAGRSPLLPDLVPVVPTEGPYRPPDSMLPRGVSILPE